MARIRLGVNIDHVATLREARKGVYPDPVRAARICERAGADSIVCHLREDRRHIQDRDVHNLLSALRKPLNLEMSVAPEIVRVARRLKPRKVTLVPEKRQELTTEGGLNVVSNRKTLGRLTESFRRRGIAVSLFIDPDRRQLSALREVGAAAVEFHTGHYADAKTARARKKHLVRIAEACAQAKAMGFEVAAGHGLHYGNVRPVARIPEIEELNIGHAIVCHAVFVGLARAVREMRGLLQ